MFKKKLKVNVFRTYKKLCEFVNENEVKVIWIMDDDDDGDLALFYEEEFLIE